MVFLVTSSVISSSLASTLVSDSFFPSVFNFFFPAALCLFLMGKSAIGTEELELALARRVELRVTLADACLSASSCPSAFRFLGAIQRRRGEMTVQIGFVFLCRISKQSLLVVWVWAWPLMYVRRILFVSRAFYLLDNSCDVTVIVRFSKDVDRNLKGWDSATYVIFGYVVYSCTN